MDTKKALAESFENLLETKRFDEITIQNIVDGCGTSRMTFYRHFKDKYELVEYIYKSKVDMFIELYDNVPFSKDTLLLNINFIFSKKKFFAEIFKISGQNSLNETLIEYSMAYFKKNLYPIFGDGIPKEILDSIKIYIAGSIYFYKVWAENDFKESPEYVMKIIYNSRPEAIKKYF